MIKYILLLAISIQVEAKSAIRDVVCDVFLPDTNKSIIKLVGKTPHTYDNKFMEVTGSIKGFQDVSKNVYSVRSTACIIPEFEPSIISYHEEEELLEKTKIITTKTFVPSIKKITIKPISRPVIKVPNEDLNKKKLVAKQASLKFVPIILKKEVKPVLKPSKIIVKPINRPVAIKKVMVKPAEVKKKEESIVDRVNNQIKKVSTIVGNKLKKLKKIRNKPTIKKRETKPMEVSKDTGFFDLLKNVLD